MSSKLDRILQMHGLIRNGTYPTVATFAERFSIRERTVYEDLQFLRERLDAPLKYDHSRRGYSYTDAAWDLPTLWMSEGELLAFFLSVELTRRYMGTNFEATLRHAVTKLASQLPNQVQFDLQLLTQHYTFHPGATAMADPVVMMALNEAMCDHWRVEIVYVTASRDGERNRRIIEPHHLYNVRGEWQVIAFDHLRQQFRNFAVSRIEEWTILKDEHFTPDPDFSAAAYLAQGFLAEHGGSVTEVVIWFDRYQARYIRERSWHPTQQIYEHNDGTLTLHLHTGALDEVRRWVMGYGRHAEVLAPASLREEVVAEVVAMAQRYGTTLPPM